MNEYSGMSAGVTSRLCPCSKRIWFSSRPTVHPIWGSWPPYQCRGMRLKFNGRVVVYSHNLGTRIRAEQPSTTFAYQTMFYVSLWATLLWAPAWSEAELSLQLDYERSHHKGHQQWLNHSPWPSADTDMLCPATHVPPATAAVI